MRLKNCPHCGVETFEHPKTKYCTKCGKVVLPDKCTNKNCDAQKEDLILPANSKFCPLCSHLTTNNAYIDTSLPF